MPFSQFFLLLREEERQAADLTLSQFFVLVFRGLHEIQNTNYLLNL